MRKSTFARLLLAGFGLMTGSIAAATLQVGPDKPFKAPCAAIAAAAPGDVIEIDAGLYSGDVCAWSTDRLTLRGVSGRAHIDAANKNAQGKGIWVPYGRDTVIENIEFSGARVPSQNGAGIRASGVNLTVRNCYFHDNQEGILESNVAGSNILIEFSEFARSGYKDGFSHNLYIGHAASLTFRFNYSHDSIVGHLLKTRAAVNYILYNRLTDENGTGSYEIDVPNGGTTYIIGNLVQQGPFTENSTVLTYLEEGVNVLNPGTDLYVVNNTFVNQYQAGGLFVRLGTAATPATIVNNIFQGPGTPTNQSGAFLRTNFTGDAKLADVNGFDYRLLDGSPAINAGSEPGSANGYALRPFYEYVHPACGGARVQVGRMDVGAYEFGGAGDPLRCR